MIDIERAAAEKASGISSLFPVFQTFFAHGRREEGGVVVGRRRSGDKAEEEDCQYNSHHRRGGSINKSPLPPSLPLFTPPPNSTPLCIKNPRELQRAISTPDFFAAWGEREKVDDAKAAIVSRSGVAPPRKKKNKRT